TEPRAEAVLVGADPETRRVAVRGHRRGCAIRERPRHARLGDEAACKSSCCAARDEALSSSSMRIHPVPCLSDNYAYLVARDGAEEAFVIDPSEVSPVTLALERENLRLVAIVNTHHHHDHVGGNEGLRERYGDLPVYAHESDEGRVPFQTERV